MNLGNGITATILKSPHHGSKTSSSEIFLETVDPRMVVISVGEDNRFGHPSPEVLERYEVQDLLILHTDQHGTIKFTPMGNGWVETAW